MRLLFFALLKWTLNKSWQLGPKQDPKGVKNALSKINSVSIGMPKQVVLARFEPVATCFKSSKKNLEIEPHENQNKV